MKSRKHLFLPISREEYIEKHLKANPSETRSEFTEQLDEAIAAYRAGKRCRCGEDIWIIGSAVVGHACFTCITGEAVPDGDYEIQVTDKP